MSRIAYVNGRYLPHRRGMVHIEDRGFQFADGVYEVIAVKDGVLIDEGLHLRRLHRSLDALRLPPPMGDAALRLVLREVLRQNRIAEGIVYLQVTRGSAPRDFPFPRTAAPSLVVTARHKVLSDPRIATEGVKVITLPDIRWSRPDIKSVALLPNALGKQQAKEAGAFEAWQVDRDGMVTEGTSSNAWIVHSDGSVATRPATNDILNGVTRLGLLQVLGASGIELVERPFSVAEAKAAAEAFLTSSSNFIVPVVRIDDAVIGDGKPGPVTLRLRRAYADYAATGGQDRSGTSR